MEQDEINDVEWARRDNWHARWFYSSSRDSRVWVRKRNPEFGWTLNLAHLAGRIWAAVLVGVPLLLVVWERWHRQ
jgi:uncharacterized membrane protein